VLASTSTPEPVPTTPPAIAVSEAASLERTRV
jgi:hypothetical protein